MQNKANILHVVLIGLTLSIAQPLNPQGHFSRNTANAIVFLSTSVAATALAAYIATEIQKWRCRSNLDTHLEYTEQISTTLADYYGIIPQEVLDVIDQLKNPKKYSDMGISMPSGILLHGKPGCGKTHLARAIAGEIKYPFFAINATDFTNTFIGQSKESVNAVFAQAKKAARNHHSKTAILFIDEFDAIGSRINDLSPHRTDIEIINTLLNNMDGFVQDDVSIIVIASTNLLERIDPALLRSGRFDYKIYIDYPDTAGRKQFIDIFCAKYPTDKNVSSDWLVEQTEGKSPADLVTLFEIAGRVALRYQKTMRDTACFVEALKSLGQSQQEQSLVK
jgi:ATP-dependent 26S proteasome regulatory subunit